MSVINQMLKDLDRRQQEAEGAAVYVAPVRQQGWWMLVLTLLCTLALGILGWRTWIFWQQSQRASLPAAQVEALRTAPAAAPSAPLAVVATTPLTDNESWSPIEPGTLMLFVDGEPVDAGRADTCAFTGSGPASCG
jgi:hypothetical protein